MALAAALVLCVSTVPGRAEDASDPSDSDAWVPHFTSRLRLESALGTDGRWQKVESVYDPKLEVDIGSDLELTAIGRARADALDEMEPGRPNQSEVSYLTRRALIGDQVDLGLRELYLQVDLDRAVLTVGKQQTVWGQADGLKVLDVVNPQNFREFILPQFSDSRIPLWSANLEVPIGDLTFTGVWVLDQTYHELPEPGAVFAFTSPRFVPALPAGVPTVIQSTDRPRRVIADSDAGFRMATFWEGWDLTFNYLYHYDDLPVFTRRLSLPGGVPTLIVTPEYRRTHLVGGTFSNAFGDLTLRGEVGSFLGKSFTTLDPADADGVQRAEELSYVLGLDWYGLEETIVSVQFFQSQVLGSVPGLLRDHTQTNITLLLRHEMLNDTLTLETIWLVDPRLGDGLVRPKISYDLNDQTTIWMGLDLFYGGDGGLFGQFDENDRVVLGLEWTF